MELIADILIQAIERMRYKEINAVLSKHLKDHGERQSKI